MKLIQNHYDLSKVKKFHTCAQYCGKKFLTQAICVKCAQRCIGSIVLTALENHHAKSFLYSNNICAICVVNSCLSKRYFWQIVSYSSNMFQVRTKLYWIDSLNIRGMFEENSKTRGKFRLK